MNTGRPAFSGFEAKPGTTLVDWAAISEQWHAFNERAFERCRGHDAPFVHAEHGNMHAFMVAAEMAGWTTLREMLGNRGDANGPSGRLDGCFIGDASIDLVEAKAYEFPLQPDGRLRDVDLRKCAKGMASAVQDARRYFNRHRLFAPLPLPKRRIGVVFHYGYWPIDAVATESWLDNYLGTLRGIDHDAMAWSFPSRAQGVPYHGSRRYPGVVMLASLAAREAASESPAW